MDEPQNKRPKVERDEAGRIKPGSTGNPGGRPKKLREFQQRLEAECYEDAIRALRECLNDDDGRVRMMAVKEFADRLFGKAPQAVTGPDGEALRVDLLGLAGTLKKLAGEADEPEPA